MSKLEDYDPDVLATLDAIDATLAGEAVDPQYAEMAELALLLADERPVMDAAFATLLDEGVERRFTAAPRREKRMRARWWAWAPAGALVASLAIAVVIVVGEGGNSGTVQLDNGVRAGAAVGTPSAPVRKTAVVVPHHKETLTPLQTATTSGQVMHRPAARALNTYSAAAQSAPAPVNGTSQTLQLPSTGRKVVQGAQLSLSTSPRRVDQVAQEVFDVVGQQKGFVNNSRVTASGGPGGNAQFQLSVPSSNLAQTMAALSSLQYARVASRTDSSQDVTNQFRVDQRHLADHKGLRTALLKQLAAAVTQSQIDSLKARIHDAEAAINSDEAALRSLNRRVGYSEIYLAVNAGAIPVPVHHSSGFTLGKAAHDAGHVLTVAAGVALIGLAALVPVALVVALLWWVGSAVRRRRRLQALDLY